jgi:hypothetical protein
MAMSNDVWAEAVATEPKTHDLTRADYALTPRDEGLRASIACWSGCKPRPGDYLILRNGDRTTRYRVTAVDLCMNVDPPTMWMATLEFAPRTAAKNPDSLSETRLAATDSK